MKIQKLIQNESCDLRSECRREADKRFFGSMFEREWEVFVIRQDPATGRFNGETVCCDRPSPGYGATSASLSC
jgi:hypothetical protein